MRRTAVELLHLAAGLAAAWAMTTLAAWSYPLGRTEIWWCGTAAMIATVAMGVRLLRRAWRKDRAGR